MPERCALAQAKVAVDNNQLSAIGKGRACVSLFFEEAPN